MLTYRLLASFAALPVLAAVAAAQEPTVNLDTLQVQVGSRASAALPVATRAVEVITAEQIRALPARTVADALGWAAGVDLMPRSPALVDFSIRGGSFEQVLVLVDGVRMSDPQTGHFDLNLAVPLEQVERIEILRGTASALYGADAVGGVVNIVTRGRGRGLQARVEGGSFGSTVLAAAGQLGSERGVRLDVAGDLGRSDGHREGADYEVAQGRAALAVPVAGRILQADVAHAARDFGADAFYGNFPSYEETRVTTASLGWLANPAARWSLEPRLAARRHGDDFILRRDNPAAYRNQHTTWQAGGELVGRYAASSALRIALGGEAFRDRLESARLGDRSEDRAAVFGEVALGQIGRSVVNAGLRTDWHSTYGAFLAPSVGVAWWPHEMIRVRGSAARAFRAPTWTERFYQDPANIGDPDLDPERSWSAEAGLDWTPLVGIRIGVGGWMRRTEGLIDWARPADATGTDPWRTRNVENATFRGAEAELGIADLFGARWTAQWTATTFAAEEVGGYASKYALRPLMDSWAVSAERTLWDRLGVAARARRARRIGEGGYLLADARLSHQWRRARLYLDFQNATGEEYLDIVGKPGAGRSVTVGAAWSTGR